MTPVTSEDAVLTIIDRHFPRTGTAMMLGRGDDCAVFRTTRPLAVSTDLFMEDIHFRRSYFTPEDIGYKALAVNVSDLAAAGASPLGFSLGLTIPGDANAARLEAMFTGMAKCADTYGLVLTGGDLSRAEKLHLCVTVFGETDGDGGLRRMNTVPGDILFVCGQLGLARAGLGELEAFGEKAAAVWPTLTAAHFRPIPRIGDGLKLASLHRSGCRLSVMDISDGLARDLPRLLGGLGADITLPDPHPELRRWAEAKAGADKANDLIRETLFRGGEDYALLIACGQEDADTLHRQLPDAILIGRVTDGGITVDGRPSAETGFDHFSAS